MNPPICTCPGLQFAIWSTIYVVLYWNLATAWSSGLGKLSGRMRGRFGSSYPIHDVSRRSPFPLHINILQSHHGLATADSVHCLLFSSLEKYYICFLISTIIFILSFLEDAFLWPYLHCLFILYFPSDSITIKGDGKHFLDAELRTNINLGTTSYYHLFVQPRLVQLHCRLFPIYFSPSSRSGKRWAPPQQYCFACKWSFLLCPSSAFLVLDK